MSTNLEFGPKKKALTSDAAGICDVPDSSPPTLSLPLFPLHFLSDKQPIIYAG